MGGLYRFKLLFQAMQWTGPGDSAKLLIFGGDAVSVPTASEPMVKTSHGWLRPRAGDWITKDTHGVFEVVPRLIFELSYEVAG